MKAAGIMVLVRTHMRNTATAMATASSTIAGKRLENPSKKTQQASGDLYLAYGMGLMGTLDLGLGLRYSWTNYDPTYFYNNPYGTSYGSFNREGNEDQWDMLTGQKIYSFAEKGTGSLSYGSSDLRIILSGQTKVSDINLLLNVAPLLMFHSNKLDWHYSRSADLQPNQPNSSTTFLGYDVTGFDPNSGEEPGTAFGVDAEVRGDYQLNPSMQLTGWLGLETYGWNTKDGKYTNQYTNDAVSPYFNVVPLSQETKFNSTTTQKWEDNGSNTDIHARARVILPANGWRIGLGVNAGTSTYKNEKTMTGDYSGNTRYANTNPVNSDDYTASQTWNNKVKYTSESTTDTIEFPIGVIFDILKNLNLQVGAKHTWNISSSTSTTEVQNQTLGTTQTNYDDGHSTSAVNTLISGYNAIRTSTITQSHSNSLYYGITWWPFEQVQVDVTGFNQILSLSNYYISMSFYF